MNGTKNATREHGFESSLVVVRVLKRTRGKLAEVLR
jgi:hypothetical protein